MDMWIRAASGMHKGRVYGLGSEFSLGRRTSGLVGSYFLSYCSVDLDEFEQLNRKVAKITKLYLQERAAKEDEATRRDEEDRLREEEMRRKDDALRLVTSDVKSLKSQINSLLESGAFHVPRSPASDDN
uniref:Uncharacterized protein n=1 Tax=Nicotiana tabacum TaxID=4097 RepID=A0A1S3X797_TOBAC|nr:PREDICTED: uncharacterized protein LOC107762080 [Nicotiana tabacum]